MKSKLKPAALKMQCDASSVRKYIELIRMIRKMAQHKININWTVTKIYSDKKCATFPIYNSTQAQKSGFH